MTGKQADRANRRAVHRQAGFTLVELMVALALSGLVIAVTYRVMTAQRRVALTEEQLSRMMQNLKGATDLMMREIRTAGFDPKRTAGAGIDSASTGGLTFKTDANGDGDFANPSPPPLYDSNEQISYRLTNDADGNGIADGFPCALGREVWNGGLQQVSENIEVLNLVYVDGTGDALPSPLSAGDLTRIRSVEITLVARSEKSDETAPRTAQFKNLRGEVIFTAPADGFRRRSLSTVVYCRNLGS